MSVVINSFPKWELYLDSVQWKDDLANAATLEAVSFQDTIVKKLCLEQESTEHKHEVLEGMRRNRLIIGSGIS